MSRQRRSFTLTEVILTILIMGILAAVVLPRFVKEGFVEGLTLRSASSQITSDIRYTRQLAITNTAHYFIKFDFKNRKYAIYRDHIQVGETKEIPSSIRCSGTDQFDFYPLGNCVFKGSGLVLSLNSLRYIIMVEPPSGAVVIEKIST